MVTDFEMVVREHLDYNDPENVRIVARIVREADTNAENRMLEAVTKKLYDHIQAKADKIDFSSIAKSRGDITKIQNYESLVDCAATIREFMVQYRAPLNSIDAIDGALANLRSRKAMFMKAFAVGSPIGTMTYNSMGLGIVYAISFMIATCVEYIKDPRTNGFTVAINNVAVRNTDKHLMFNSLRDFNKSCLSGEFDQAMGVALKQARVRREAADLNISADLATDTSMDPSAYYTTDTTVLHDEGDDKDDRMDWDVHQESIALVGYIVVRAFIFIAKLLIPLIRNVVYLWYHTKQTISDFFAQQAQLLEMNAYQLQYNNQLDEEEKKRIFEKQMAIAQRWKMYARKFDVDYNSASRAAEADAAADDAESSSSEDSGYNDNDEGEYYPSDGGIF